MDLSPAHWAVPLVQCQLTVSELPAPHTGHGGVDVLVSEGAGTAATGSRPNLLAPESLQNLTRPRQVLNTIAVTSACVPTPARAQLAQGDPDTQSRSQPHPLTPDLLAAPSPPGGSTVPEC